MCFYEQWQINDRLLNSSAAQLLQLEQMTHKSGLEVPTPAIVEKTNKHGSQEITNQQRDVGCHGIRYDESDKLLQSKTTHVVSTFTDSLFAAHNKIKSWLLAYRVASSSLLIHYDLQINTTSPTFQNKVTVSALIKLWSMLRHLTILDFSLSHCRL